MITQTQHDYIHLTVKVTILSVSRNRGNNAYNYLVIDPSLLRALVLTILWSSQLQAPMARTLMISFHKIIGGYLSLFATSFALRPSGSVHRHMRAIKHPLESETEFPQHRRTPGTSVARHFRELVLVTITDIKHIG